MLDQVIGDIRKGVSTRSQVNNFCKYYAFISQIHPKTISDALLDDGWLLDMQEELVQFKRNDVWDLVPHPYDKTVIGIRWVFRNKLDANGIIIRNGARLLEKGYNEAKGVGYEDTYVHVDHLKAIGLLLAFAHCLSFKLYQMDVK